MLLFLGTLRSVSSDPMPLPIATNFAARLLETAFDGTRNPKELGRAQSLREGLEGLV
jgi:hypothetical protein